MENGWYYARIDQKIGPFSPRQLKDLADAGTILRTDTVWKAGVVQGVRADRVKNLFAVVIAAPAPIPAVSEPDEVEAPRLVPLAPAGKAAEPEASAPAAEVPAPAKAPPPKHPPKGRAIALSGAIIVSQDGTRARFRMVCKTCGHQDSACQSLMITNKTFKRNFYCPKCRKRRDVSIQCQTR